MADCVKVCNLFVCLFLAVWNVALSELMERMTQDQISTSMVNIKPGAGRQTVEHKLEGLRCKFHYKAQGGTNEEWMMAIVTNEDHTEWTCVVERPGTKSYLFFEEFKLEVLTGQLKEAKLESGPGVPLLNSEYIINLENNYVQQWDNKFNSQLNKVEVYSTSPKRLNSDL